MGEIISIAQVKDEQEGVFAIRGEDGELKDVLDYTGDDWANLIEGCFANIAKEFQCSKYDILADFMHQILGGAT